MPPRRSPFFAVSVLTTVIGCQFVAGLQPPSSPDDSPAVADAMSIDASARACGRRPPARITTPSSSGDAQFFVLTTISTSLPPGGGFDVDCVDSVCVDGKASRPGCIPRAGLAACDEPGGIDIQANRLSSLRNINNVGDYPADATKGTRALILGLFGYSGEADDSEVAVLLFPSNGARDPRACRDAGVAERVDGGGAAEPVPPQFDGCDRFSPDPAYVLASGVAVAAPAAGYVVNHRLVVNGGPMRFLVPYGVRYIEASAQFVEGALEQLPGSNLTVLRDLVVGGSIRAEALLRVLGEQRQAPSPPLCQQPEWAAARRELCAALDLPALGRGPDSTCDALSFALAARGEAVLLGHAETVVARAPVCGSSPQRDAGTDAESDAGADTDAGDSGVEGGGLFECP